MFFCIRWLTRMVESPCASLVTSYTIPPESRHRCACTSMRALGLQGSLDSATRAGLSTQLVVVASFFCLNGFRVPHYVYARVATIPNEVGTIPCFLGDFARVVAYKHMHTQACELYICWLQLACCARCGSPAAVTCPFREIPAQWYHVVQAAQHNRRLQVSMPYCRDSKEYQVTATYGVYFLLPFLEYSNSSR